MRIFYNFELSDFNNISKSDGNSKVTTIKSRSSDLNEEFDIFLSHNYDDAKIHREMFIEIIEYFENKKYNVYVDWIDDLELNRNNITIDTAKIIKERLKNSKCLIYLTSQNSDNSKWMPWELGIKDGIDGKVVIMPLVDNREKRFKGQEYLGLYPEIGFLQPLMTNMRMLCIGTKSKKILSFDTWIKE